MHTTTRTMHAVVGAVVGAILATAAPAAAVQLEPADRDGGARRVTYVERVAPRTFYVETGDGATFQVRRCRTEEDPRPCVWDAARRGNGRGTSYVRVTRDGDTLPIRPRLMRSAY